MKNKNNKVKDKVKDNVDFWKEAQDFLKTVLPEDFQDKIHDWLKNKDFTENDVRLFKCMLEEAIGFEVTMIILKHYL